jgi:hypothetical protein
VFPSALMSGEWSSIAELIAVIAATVNGAAVLARVPR